ncbi:hypothetical protein RHSIM_Rhsim03G0081700 [Rhododendron simsii]|uniref:C2H2-type domain-containing protein n=1 Tax=Rhododendron simsii TaxID=118357 RepID=A0A834H8D0_RHOSS|nr:hypothetical protein RHSIM_Rhsim03G0081700 [Rhododendron simsii]
MLITDAGVEVKSGEPCPVEAGQGRILHLSQACLGEVKKDKGNDCVYLYVTVDGKKLVLGTLSSEKFPQLQFDLVFDGKFELSHSWKNGIFYSPCFRFLVGVLFFFFLLFPVFLDCLPLFIITIEDDSEDESEEDLPANVADNGVDLKPESQATCENLPATQNATSTRPDSAASKKKVKIVEPKKDVKTIEEDDSSEDDFGADSSEDELDSDEDEDGDSESGEGDTEDDIEEEETPRKVELSKKRPAVSATATQGPDKKAKFITPQKTETKKGGGHVDTPYPSKQAGKTPANQSKQQTPKPAGSHPCKSCNRSFNSENALDSHTKAKHTPGK